MRTCNDTCTSSPSLLLLEGWKFWSSVCTRETVSGDHLQRRRQRSYFRRSDFNEIKEMERKSDERSKVDPRLQRNKRNEAKKKVTTKGEVLVTSSESCTCASVLFHDWSSSTIFFAIAVLFSSTRCKESLQYFVYSFVLSYSREYLESATLAIIISCSHFY